MQPETHEQARKRVRAYLRTLDRDTALRALRACRERMERPTR